MKFKFKMKLNIIFKILDCFDEDDEFCAEAVKNDKCVGLEKTKGNNFV